MGSTIQAEGGFEKWPRCDISVDSFTYLGSTIQAEGGFEKWPRCDISVDSFTYLGSTIQAEGGFEKDVTNRIGAGWNKFREMSGVTCDKKVPEVLNTKIYETAIRPTMIHGGDCWATRKCEQNPMNTT